MRCLCSVLSWRLFPVLEQLVPVCTIYMLLLIYPTCSPISRRIRGSNNAPSNERSSYDQLLSTKCIISTLEIALDYNIASFNRLTYRQELVAAMGPKNSSEYADCANVLWIKMIF